MKKILLLLCFFVGFSTNAQHYLKENIISIKEYEFVVYFKDKVGTPFSIEFPLAFLSQKSLDRRLKYNIPVTVQDLPVNPAYIEGLRGIGVEVLKVSKWLNCAVISVRDTSIMLKVRELPFVVNKPLPLPKNYVAEQIQKKSVFGGNKEFLADSFYYGFAVNQTTMINVHKLHNLKFDGRGVTIAVFDVGFMKIDKLSIFDSLWKNNQILGWYDFVDMDTTLFDKGTHGMNVLSIIGGNLPDYVGTAPKASFWLFATEDGRSETQIEEYNYVIACEKADSVGVDIITSSLGYYRSDVEQCTYSYDDLDGNTAISSIGADIAAAKGIFVITSAGNEGSNAWRHIVAPADADSVLTVGAVDFAGEYAYFSSLGPTADGRIKPDLVAPGKFVCVAEWDGERGKIGFCSGTSFSAPIVSGAVACLCQAFPNSDNMEIFDALRATASNAKKPDKYYGYGVPDCYKTYLFLKKRGKKN